MTKMLTLEIIKQLREHFKSYQYQKDSVHCYPGQVPAIAFILLKGRVVISNKKESYEMSEGESWGISYLLEQRRINHEIKILEGTEILCLDRTTIQKLLTQKSIQGRALDALMS